MAVVQYEAHGLLFAPFKRDLLEQSPPSPPAVARSAEANSTRARPICSHASKLTGPQLTGQRCWAAYVLSPYDLVFWFAMRGFEVICLLAQGPRPAQECARSASVSLPHRFASLFALAPPSVVPSFHFSPHPPFDDGDANVTSDTVPRSPTAHKSALARATMASLALPHSHLVAQP